MPTQAAELYRFGEFVLHVSDGRLLKDGHPVALAPKPFEMLVYLVRRPGRVVSKQELLDALWPDIHVTEDGVVQCIVEIRKVLGDRARGSHFIETIPRRGYSFVGHLDEEAEAAAPRPAEPVPEPPPSDAPAFSAMRAPVPAPPDAGERRVESSPSMRRVVPVGPRALVFALLLLVVGMALLAAWTRPGGAAAVTQPRVAPGTVVVLPLDVLEQRMDAWIEAQAR